MIKIEGQRGLGTSWCLIFFGLLVREIDQRERSHGFQTDGYTVDGGEVFTSGERIYKT